MRESMKTRLYEWLLIIVGSVLTALAFNLFFIPNDIAPGGLSGLATLVHALIPQLSVGLVIILFNIPLFLAGWRVRGHVFMVRTLVSTLLLSLLIDYLKLPQEVYNLFKGDMILSTVYGGILMGTGVGLTIKGNATTGGTDLAAIIVDGIPDPHGLVALCGTWFAARNAFRFPWRSLAGHPRRPP